MILKQRYNNYFVPPLILGFHSANFLVIIEWNFSPTILFIKPFAIAPKVFFYMNKKFSRSKQYTTNILMTSFDEIH